MASTDQTGKAPQRSAEAGAAPQTKVRPLHCAVQAESLGATTGLSPLHHRTAHFAVTGEVHTCCVSTPRGELHG